MEIVRLPGFVGPSYILDSKNLNTQRCVNLYPKLYEVGASKEGEVAGFVGTPGLRLKATIGSGPIRGSYRATNGSFYIVSGDKFYRINSSFEATEIGKLSTSVGAIDMVDNGQTLIVVDGPNGYWHTLSSSVLTKISGASWLGSSKVGYIDGYFLFNDPNTGVFYISNLNSIVIDALDFASASGAPDNIVSTLVNHREVWLFGDDSIEVWYNSGNADFPFNRVSGGLLEFGCVAAHSVAKIERVNFWLGKNKDGQGVVYAAQGLSPQRISTHAVEYAIQGYGDISDARAWTYQENGHSFYVLNFTSANTTWVFDLTTKQWHERAYLKLGNFQRHRADCHNFVFNMHIVGDYENGNIYQLDSNYYSDNLQEIRRERISPFVSSESKRIKVKSFELDCETGVGLPSGSDPQAMLQFSDDGGHTWSNEKWVSIGRQGSYKSRALWRRLGVTRERVFRVVISDPVKVAINGAEIEVERMAS